MIILIFEYKYKVIRNLYRKAVWRSTKSEQLTNNNFDFRSLPLSEAKKEAGTTGYEAWQVLGSLFSLEAVLKPLLNKYNK